jgi:ethanolamine transporter EutH
VATTGADRMASGRTTMAADWTGFALANAVCCTAITAPGAARFTYVTLVTLTFTVLFTITVLVTLIRFR